MKRKHDSAAIRMLHPHMTAFAVNLDKTEPLQGGQDLPARQQGSSQGESDDLMRFVVSEILWRWFEIKLNSLLDISKRLFPSCSLRPATLERWTMRGKIPVFSAVHDHMQSHGMLLREKTRRVNRPPSGRRRTDGGSLRDEQQKRRGRFLRPAFE